MLDCSHETLATLDDIQAAQCIHMATFVPIASPNQFALLETDDDTSLHDPTTTGVTTGRLGDSIDMETTADEDNLVLGEIHA